MESYREWSGVRVRILRNAHIAMIRHVFTKFKKIFKIKMRYCQRVKYKQRRKYMFFLVLKAPQAKKIKVTLESGLNFYFYPKFKEILKIQGEISLKFHDILEFSRTNF